MVVVAVVVVAAPNLLPLPYIAVSLVSGMGMMH